MPNPEICAVCAADGRSCCHLARVFLTTGDIGRIAAAIGRTDFHEPFDPSRLSAMPDAGLDPSWHAALFSGGRTLRRQADGSGCLFLTAKGCLLSEEVRPLICRLYPFEYTADTVSGVNPDLCPSSLCDNVPLLLALLGMNRERAEMHRRQLYAELGGREKESLPNDGG